MSFSNVDPVTFVDLGGGLNVTVGGITVRGETSNQQTRGQQAPTKSAENGYVYTTRVGPTATEGEINGWVNSDEMAALDELADEKEPIPITTPEGSYSQCVVDDIDRTTEAERPDAYNVTISWREILQASTSTSRIRAITKDGQKSGAAGGPNDGNNGQSTLGRVGKETKSDGPDAGGAADAGEGQATESPQTGNNPGGPLGSVGQTISGWF